MTIKCSLIEVDNDHRAIICVGEGAAGSVKKTHKIRDIDYACKVFYAGRHVYDFSK